MCNHRLSISELSRFLIWSLLFSLLVDIGGGFGLKYIVSAIFIGFGLVKSVRTRFEESIFFDVFVCAFFFGAALLSVIRGNDFGAALSEVSFLAYAFFICVGKGVGSKFIEDLFLKVSFCAAIIIVVVFMLIILSPELGIAATPFAREYRLGYIGLRSLDGGVPNVYFRWSCWLLLGLSLSLFSKKYLLSFFMFVAALMTLSTAIIGGIFIVIFLYFLLDKNSLLGKIFNVQLLVALSLISVLIAVEFFPAVLQEILAKFSSSSTSTSVKMGHINSILALLSDSPLYLFYGQGPGSSFYSIGANSFVSNVEVSHFNLVRQFGLLGFIVYFFYFSYVVMSLFRLGRSGYPWAVGLAVIFIVAGTNPLLLSPIFFVPLILGRVFYLEYVEEKRYGRCKS